MSAVAVRIGLGQLRSDTRGYLSQVSTGQMLEISRRGKFVARIVSSAANQRDGRANGSPRYLASPPIRVGLSELRERAGRCLDYVAAGQTIEVLCDGRIVAYIEPIANDLPRPTTSPTPKS